MKKLLLFFLFVPICIWSQSNFEKGEKLFQAKKYDDAQSFLEAVVKVNPSDIKALEYLGDIAAHQKAWVKGAEYYKKLKVLKPTVADYFFKYGGCLAMRAMEVNKLKAFGMVDDMKEAFEKAIVLNPKHVQARWALIEIYLQLPGILGGSESKGMATLSSLSMTVEITAQRGWASALFVGTRFTMTCETDDDGELFEHLLASLPEQEIHLHGHFVASADVIERRTGAAVVDVLVIEER